VTSAVTVFAATEHEPHTTDEEANKEDHQSDHNGFTDPAHFLAFTVHFFFARHGKLEGD